MAKIFLSCQYCGKPYLKHECYAERSKYCSRQCHGKAAGVRQRANAVQIRACPICGTEFETTQHHGGKKTCSAQCAHKLKSRKAGQTRRNPEKRTIQKCQFCSRPFEAYRSRNRKFCSSECRGAHKSKMGRVIKPCAYCGKPTEFIKAQIELRNGRYCSKECRYNAVSEQRKGENNPNWIGGCEQETWRGANWTRQKRKAKRRDNYTCKKCGSHFKQSSRELHVHHIVPFRLFDTDYESANQLDNLICLCSSCHVTVEYLTREHVRGIQVAPATALSLLSELRPLIWESPKDSMSNSIAGNPRNAH